LAYRLGTDEILLSVKRIKGEYACQITAVVIVEWKCTLSHVESVERN